MLGLGWKQQHFAHYSIQDFYLYFTESVLYKTAIYKLWCNTNISVQKCNTSLYNSSKSCLFAHIKWHLGKNTVNLLLIIPLGRMQQFREVLFKSHWKVMIGTQILGTFALCPWPLRYNPWSRSRCIFGLWRTIVWIIRSNLALKGFGPDMDLAVCTLTLEIRPRVKVMTTWGHRQQLCEKSRPSIAERSWKESRHRF